MRVALGAAAMGLLAPVGLDASASAATATSPQSPSLAVTPTTVTSSSTVTNTFTTVAPIASGGSITISSDNTASTGQSGNSIQLPSTPLQSNSDYATSYKASGSSTSTSVQALLQPGSTTTDVTLDVGSAIPAGAAVTVTITGATNPGGPATVYLTDATSGDTATASTNQVSIQGAAATSSVATVSDVNPRVVVAEGGTPFTLTGSFYVSAGNEPVVCFVPTTSPSAPPASAVSATGCGPGTAAVVPADTNVTGTQIQAVSPALGNTNGLPDASYNVIVYNYDPTSSGYQAGSATSASTEVMSVSGLDVVPESGVRVADSRSGMNLPSGPIGSGKTAGFAVASILQSMTLPSNIPSTATGIAMNVTAVAPTGAGNLQVFSPATASCSGQSTTVATVNFQPGQDTANYTIVPLAAVSGRMICVTDNGASVNVVIDVTGYTTSNYGGADLRLLDTRSATHVGSLQGPLAAGKVFQVNTGLAANEKVALDVTAVGPTEAGNLRLFPEPSSGPPAASGVPNTAVVNYIPGTDEGSFYVTETGNNGNIDIISESTGTVNVVIDLYGTITSSHVNILGTPYRIYDSRPAGIGSGQTVTVTASPSTESGGGSSFIPANAAAVIGSLADINPNSVGNLRTFPTGASLPNTASVPNYPNQVRENLIMSALNPSNGEFSIYSSGSFTDATFDASGYIN
ncbi:MAG TPA: hypothetical protein VFP54_03615 [Acidimicrobiales bacterium]|nr:hypothetical protein [Acidimicrobiales bacterium]